jgi:N-methylhydantoinase B
MVAWGQHAPEGSVEASGKVGVGRGGLHKGGRRLVEHQECALRRPPTLAASMRHFLAAFPEPDPGDVLLTNEPWLSSGQLNDLTVVTPIHAGEQAIGFVGSTCHAVDIGGRGLSADAAEVFEEGLRIPPMRLHSAGSPNNELLELIGANVRTPELVLGDLHAQVVGNGVGVARVRELAEDLELGDLDWLSTEVSARSERRLREAITALPDGVYESEVVNDGLEEAVRIRCAVEVTGDRLIVDYAGSSPQSERGINVVMNYTEAYTTYAVKCALAPDVPHNEGTFRPLEVRAPEGSILNARFPAAVAARHVIGQFLPFAVLEALAPVAPNAAMAQGAGNIWLTTVRGRQSGEPFVAVFFASGGMGARPERDGLSTTSFPSGIATTPAEVVESTSPIVVEEKSLRSDSGGPGRRRGGLGQRIRISVREDAEWTVACLGDRLRHPAPGMAGGGRAVPAVSRFAVRRSPNRSSRTPCLPAVRYPWIFRAAEASGRRRSATASWWRRTSGTAGSPAGRARQSPDEAPAQRTAV